MALEDRRDGLTSEPEPTTDDVGRAPGEVGLNDLLLLPRRQAPVKQADTHRNDFSLVIGRARSLDSLRNTCSWWE